VKIQCPICKTVIENAPDDFAFRPFCSQRCKLADLDNWLTGAYRISSPLRPGEAGEDEYKLNN
jgi:endogenous inhibitor of DNA gyrase (YacG/DUF329 family)